MIKRIYQLPAVIANQIAAGEVIERPASVVKELLENALDAQATHIHIELNFGGLNQIKVSDNGLGIVAEDLPLAIAAHATSKITQLTDLYAIKSMGFRGEALASIASIARLSISSKPEHQETGMKLVCSEETMQLIPCARATGTSIDVCDIFYNAPVRKKFLKSEAAEYKAIEAIVKRFALSAPHIAITLIHNGKNQLQLPAALKSETKTQRIAKLLGKAFIENSILIDCQHEAIHLTGWVSNSQYQRNQNDKMWVYINGRMVKDKLVNHAIKLAYNDLLFPDRYPSCLLYLTITPSEVDVNVHPTKHEVRFQHPRLVHDFIYTSLREKLGAKPENSANKMLPHLQESKKSSLPFRPSLSSDFFYFILNETFAILTFDNKPYLANIIQLHQEYLLHTLQQAAFPFPSRPLLIPLNFEHDIQDGQKRQDVHNILGAVGVQTTFNGQNCTVHSLPIAVPELAIKNFFCHILQLENATPEQAMAGLVKHQTFNAYQLSRDQCEIYTYLHQEKALKSMLELSTARCHAILNLEVDQFV